jgi:hypothetical protein
LTNEFTISDVIHVEAEIEKSEFAPGEGIVIEGSAVKENGENVQGFVDLVALSEDLKESFKMTDTIKDGIIDLNFSLADDAKAGLYLLQVKVYEKGTDNNITNQGLGELNIEITQVPTSLEIYFAEKKAIPGGDYKMRAVLHDQSGEKIESTAILKIRNANNKLVEQVELNTDESYNLPIEYSEPAAEWSVYAKSEGLESESTFEIIEKQAVKIELVNRTVLLTNMGNIPYNDTVTIKIGNDTVEIDSYIKVEDTQKYTLSAPDGEYDVEIISGDGEDDRITGRVMLTGKVVEVEESSGISFLSSFVWLFMILVLGFVAFTVYRKGYKKTFLGRIIPRRKPRDKTTDKDIASAESLVDPKHPAELSLSIKGHKQNTSIICLKIKNEAEVIKNKDAVKDIFNKITTLAEDNKASVYENKSNIFFIFAPARTKTFDNQKTAVRTAEKIKELLDVYNKLAKYKVDFGLGLNYGTIVAQHQKDSLKFMSMGTLITTARKLANHSRSEILLSEDLNNKVRANIKSEKHSAGNLDYYKLTEIKKKVDNKKFISNFIRKLEKENKEAAERKAKEKKKQQNKSE